MRQRITLSFSGVLLCAISVGMFKFADFGMDPFQTFGMGLNAVAGFGLSYGTYYVILCAILLVIPLIFGRHFINIATFINLFLAGYVMDGTIALLQFIFSNANFWFRVSFLTAGLILLCLSSALYYTADLGVSAYDAIPLLISEKSVIPFKLSRTGCDILCICIGWFCGMSIGVATMLTAFCMGPLTSFFRSKIETIFVPDTQIPMAKYKEIEQKC